jgi:pyruvate-formate lyase-activating enzyme
MADLPTPYFKQLCAVTKTWLKRHKEHKDTASMRNAAFACGKVAGVYVAYNEPSEWEEMHEDVRKLAEEAGIP